MKLTFKNSIKVISLLVLFNLTACSNAENTSQVSANMIALDVYKSPSCQCCQKWVNQLEDSGFKSSLHHSNNLSKIKKDFGIEGRYQSCHTAVSKDGYVFEGHIPPYYIKQFLNNPPENAAGLIVPKMPLGSPGMEVGDKFQPYSVLLLNKDGTMQEYASVKSLSHQNSLR